MNKGIILFLILLLIGLIGVSSNLLSDFPIPKEAQPYVPSLISVFQFKILNLINPTILLVICTTVGCLLYKKANFKVPVINYYINSGEKTSHVNILKHGAIGGLIAGILIIIISEIFYNFLPKEFLEIAENFNPHILTKILYGGISEELMVRFGVMTFLTWLFFQITQNLSKYVYWIAIIISSILFGLGHLPLIINVLDTPSTAVYIYIIVANSIGGIIFGWLYWKKGLEASMIAHIFSHLIIFFIESIFNFN